MDPITIILLQGNCPQSIKTHKIERMNIMSSFETIDVMLFPLICLNILLKLNIKRKEKKRIATPP